MVYGKGDKVMQDFCHRRHIRFPVKPSVHGFRELLHQVARGPEVLGQVAQEVPLQGGEESLPQHLPPSVGWTWHPDETLPGSGRKRAAEPAAKTQLPTAGTPDRASGMV